MTPGDLRLYGWLLQTPATPESIVRELAGTVEDRNLQRVNEDLRHLVVGGQVTPIAGRFVWSEARDESRSMTEQIADVLRIAPLTIQQLMRALSSPISPIREALAHGPFRELSQRWHVVGPR